MKKVQICMVIVFIILMILGIVFFITHTQKQSVETDMTPNEIVTAIIESQTELPSLNQITSENEEFVTYLSDYYLIDSKTIENGVIYYADGVEASEIAVLILRDEKNSGTIKTILTGYIQNRAGIFEGYAPKQAALVKKGEIIVNGKYVALLICKDTDVAKTAFLNCFGESQKSSSISTTTKSDNISKTDNSNKIDSEYDSTSVLKAWKSEDTSFLSKTDSEILEVAKKVINQEIKDNMTDYEKELAIHDWITNWSSFDYSVFDRSGNNLKEGSDTPYGVLIEREAMCHGYSSTFKLFMDMLDIECITVFGTPNSNGVEHSWNMVKLDGEWYCVDVAWDDPIGGSPTHTYFNVTSKYLRNSGIHKWNDSNVPEATATTYAFGNH
ncbi:MAG: DUF4358 domain-containing protein [Clostridia bacterium]|nr:DUF4358 domain-containing protein [Clostridia bacterium]